MFELERLNALNAPAFGHLTFRSYQFVLYGLSDMVPQFAFGALVDGRAAGLAIGEATPAKSTVLSICVDSKYQNRGVGASLLRMVEQELVARQADSATVTYVTGRPGTAPLERILAKCGWPESHPKHLVCTSDKRMYTAPWMADYKLPSDFEVFRWVDITAADRAELERCRVEEGWIPSELWPFDYDQGLEPANSLGVRYKGRVVGWVITQAREPDAVCYCCSYMRPDLQRRGRLVAAYAEAVRRQVEFTTKPIGIWIVPYRHKAMVAFVQRRMTPYLISLAEFRESRKIFRDSVCPVASRQAMVQVGAPSGAPA